MKTLHFDCFAGISGDMALGAFVDLGVDPNALRAELNKLGLDGWKLDFVRDERCGIGGIRAIVELEAEGDHHAHEHSHEHSHEHAHRSWRDIRSLIERSGIGNGAKKRALDIFSRIAAAESQVHGVPEDEIAFHEVGALDSIIDAVGAAVCLDMLNPERITCGEVELGGGMVRCAHGLLPVPAPATVILCRGMPVKTGGFDKEMTTPTGAAILAASVDAFTATGRFRELKTGYGVGARKMSAPNLLRVSWREEYAPDTPEAGLHTEELTVIEANIDDMSGEAMGFLLEILLESGALDVTLSPCVMKKSRPGTVLSALCPPAKLPELRRVVFQHSSTIGFREIPVRRVSLTREEGLLSGGSRVKTVFLNGAPLRSKIEYEDRARAAKERGVSLEDAEKMLRDSSAPGASR
ncbi:MAG: nickel pincer cofactor biosynthesis protein LarC [Treponema sp.]|jgi:uncharacterized protein (TIGR00299 family) protein|nr:nickel pincer cofactor biosynthesis protein LarC [Treponema sp.]